MIYELLLKTESLDNASEEFSLAWPLWYMSSYTIINKCSGRFYLYFIFVFYAHPLLCPSHIQRALVEQLSINMFLKLLCGRNEMAARISLPLHLCGCHTTLTTAAMMNLDMLQCASLDNHWWPVHPEYDCYKPQMMASSALAPANMRMFSGRIFMQPLWVLCLRDSTYVCTY